MQALPQIQLIMESELWQDSEGPGVGHQGISEKTVILEGKWSKNGAELSNLALGITAMCLNGLSSRKTI